MAGKKKKDAAWTPAHRAIADAVIILATTSLLVFSIYLCKHFGIMGSCPMATHGLESSEIIFMGVILGVALTIFGARRFAELTGQIRELKETEARLQASEERYRLLFENANELILVAQDYRIKFCNQKVCEATGYDQHELTNLPFIKLIHPDDVDLVKENHRKRINDEDPLSTYDFRIVRRNGAVRWLAIGAVRISWEGKPATLNFLNDITERREATEALRESRRTLSTLMSNLPGMAFRCANSREWAMEFVSEGCLELSGYSPSEITDKSGSGYVEFIHPDDRDRIWGDIQQAISRDKSYKVEYRLITKNGDEKWVWEQGCGIPDQAGRIVALEGFITDITDQKRAEEMLRLTEFSVDNAADSVFWLNHEGRFFYVNKKACEALGYSRSELLSLTIYDVDPLMQQGSWPEHWERTKQKGTVLLESQHQKKNGDTIPVEILISYMQFEGHEYHCSFARDISERKQGREALRQSEERFRMLVENQGEGVAIVDLDGIFTFANPATHEIFGVPSGTLTGRHVTDFLDTDLHVIMQRETEAGIPQSKPSFEKVVTRPDGSQCIIMGTTTPLYGPDGSLISILGVMSDITEKRRIEDELAKADKLETVGLLAGGIAHDFNNALAAILGNVSLAKMDLDTESELHSILSDAERATLQAQELTRQLLTFAKGGAPLREVISIEDLIRETSSFATRGSKVRCTLNIGPGLPSVEADRGQLGQVIQNLIINADQAMPEGGTIEVAARVVSPGQDACVPDGGGRFVKLTVTDQGSGIPESIRSKIFDPFFTTKPKGTGLGLASAYSIVSQHGGRITVDSVTGEGTTVTIYLPASLSIATEHTPEGPAVPKGTGKILVMDDESFIREMLSRMLTRLGYEAMCVNDGESAIAQYRQAQTAGSPFDAVIMDLTIPGGIGGKQAAQELLAKDPDARIIVSSGYSNDPVMSSFSDHGFVACISKPFKSNDLARILCDALAPGITTSSPG